MNVISTNQSALHSETPSKNPKLKRKSSNTKQNKNPGVHFLEFQKSILPEEGSLGPCVLASGDKRSRQLELERGLAIHSGGDWNKTATQVSQVQRPHLEVLPHPHCRQDMGVRSDYPSRSAVRGDEGRVYATESEED